MKFADCGKCHQAMLKASWSRHGWEECRAYDLLRDSMVRNSFLATVPSAVSKLKAHNIVYESHMIQAERGDGWLTVYVTEEPAAFLCNIWKGKCLNYLLKEYTTDTGFQACLLNFLDRDDKRGAVAFCEDVWISDNMRVDDDKVKAAIVKFVQMTEDSFYKMQNEARKVDYGEFKGAFVLYGNEINEIREARLARRQASRGKGRRKAGFGWVTPPKRG